MKAKSFAIFLFIFIYPIYLYLYTYNNEEVHTKSVYVDGDNVIVKKINGKLLMKKEHDYNLYNLEGSGSYTLYFENDELIGTRESYFNFLRKSLDRRLRKIFNNDLYYFSKAILLNEKYYLDTKLKSRFKEIGLMHLIAISGLHMSIIYSFILSLFRYCNFRIREFISLIFLTIYSLVVGFTPSITRAYIMILLLIISKILYESIDNRRAFLISLLANVIYNPYQIAEYSFILTYACTFCIIYIPIKNILVKNLCMQVVLLPLNYLFFKKVYLLSFIINTIFIPLFTILIFLILFNIFLPTKPSLELLYAYFYGLQKIVINDIIP